MDQMKMQGPSKADTPRHSLASSIIQGKEQALDAMDTAETDLKALQTDLSNLKETVAKLVSQAGGEAAKSAREIGGRVSTATNDLTETGAKVASLATSQAKTLVTELEEIARRNPLGALAGAIAVGVLIGMMGRRS
jgi:ElaB/YqjD/DUF883 family membrane-anchored ribosome-binding protein